MNIRLTPHLDRQEPNLANGIYFEGRRVLGKPEQSACYFYENGVAALLKRAVYDDFEVGNDVPKYISSISSRSRQ